MGKVLTDEQQKIQTEIDKLNKQINDYNTQISGHKNRIELETNIVNPLKRELKRLEDLLKNARDTPNEYDKLKSQIQLKKRELQTCGNKITQIKNDIISSGKNIEDIQFSYDSLFEKYNILRNKKSVNDAQLILDRVYISELSEQLDNLVKEFSTLQQINQENITSIDSLNSRINELNNIIVLLELKNDSNIVYNNEKLLTTSKNIDSSLNSMFNYLKKKNISSEVFYEKIEYRDIEHEKLYNTNKLIDILFYCFYFAFILIMICIGNTNREHFLIYLFVGLIPFIYPFIFKLLLYINNYLYSKVHGPKNAFVDINNTLYA